MELKKVISSLGMPLGLYLKRFAIPVIAFGFIFSYILGTVLPDMFVGSAHYILYALPVICILFTVAYPYSIASGKALAIDHNMHYFITQFGSLANADTSRSEMFLIMSKNTDLGSLADELGKIYLLTNTWNMSLSSACRFISERTPSDMFADFLDRFAHATQSGEKMSDFLNSEQNVVMTDFETMYSASLTTVGVIIEMFVSLVMSVIFMASFSVIMPIVTGMDATLLMSISVASFVVMDVGVLLFVKRTLPNDPIWHKLDLDTEADMKLKRSIIISLFGCLVAGLAATLFLQSLPTSIKLAITITPLMYTGRVASIEEAKIKRKDLNYPSFIRSLGSSAGARGGMINDALKSLKAHDFGPLTANIHALYSRLNTRINKMGAWSLFSAETGSNLIQRFSEMFVQATHLGAKAEVVGELISTNFHRITTMRKKRYQTAASIVGVFYGLAAGIGFTLYISLGVVELMQAMFSSVQMPAGSSMGMLLYTDVVDMPALYMLVTIIIILHSLLSALLIRVIDGGNLLNGTVHFVGMVWISVIAAEASKAGVFSMLGIGTF